jgi:DNA-binding MarR family transcriptional regulator
MAFYDADNFFPDTSVGYLMKVCNQLAQGQLDEAFAPDGLTATQWSALISIHFGHGTTCAVLARKLAHDKGAMTRLIDGLEQRGLVSRDRDAGDRRYINLALTEEGLAVTQRCRLRVIDCWNAWLGDWSDAEIAQLIAQLQKLRTTLESVPPCAA